MQLNVFGSGGRRRRLGRTIHDEEYLVLGLTSDNMELRLIRDDLEIGLSRDDFKDLEMDEKSGD